MKQKPANILFGEGSNSDVSEAVAEDFVAAIYVAQVNEEFVGYAATSESRPGSKIGI